MKLTVVLGASSEASFDILLNDNSFVRKWVKELEWCLQHCDINQHEAFFSLLPLGKVVEIETVRDNLRKYRHINTILIKD